MYKKFHENFAIYLSFLIGILLSILSLPISLEIFRPLWLPLLLIFWGLYAPKKVGMITAWLLGFLQDILYGTLIGKNALILTLAMLLVVFLKKKMHFSSGWQQLAIVITILSMLQSVEVLLNSWDNKQETVVLLELIPILTSIVFWLLIRQCLGRYPKSPS